jgi:hypothetical protein
LFVLCLPGWNEPLNFDARKADHRPCAASW